MFAEKGQKCDEILTVSQMHDLRGSFDKHEDITFRHIVSGRSKENPSMQTSLFASNFGILLHGEEVAGYIIYGRDRGNPNNLFIKFMATHRPYSYDPIFKKHSMATELLLQTLKRHSKSGFSWWGTEPEVDRKFRNAMGQGKVEIHGKSARVLKWPEPIFPVQPEVQKQPKKIQGKPAETKPKKEKRNRPWKRKK
ncbi:MAG: hypothetical protein ABID38_05840 [Candidatus Diapherotrites archaeon]